MKQSLLASVLAMCLFAPAAHAVTFVLNDVSTGGMSAQQRAGFQAAADYWSGKLSDNVTVYLDIGFNNLGQNVLGSTGSTMVATTYSSMRGMLQADATSALDSTVIAHLPTGSAVSFWATQGDGSARFDNDGSANNRYLAMTSANAKAVGYVVPTSAALADAHIVFANAYAASFDYSRSGGTPANKIDFVTVAQHEIGHALGFTSGIDEIDYCMGPGNGAICGIGNDAGRFENSIWYQPLDLFRYSAPGVADVRVGGTPYFSVDGGATSIAYFSTGSEHGDGWQASHFTSNAVNLMRPFVGFGQSYDATPADLYAMDAIGWNLAAPVPEPQTWAMLLAGFSLLGWRARRRRD